MYSTWCSAAIPRCSSYESAWGPVLQALTSQSFWLTLCSGPIPNLRRKGFSGKLAVVSGYFNNNFLTGSSLRPVLLGVTHFPFVCALVSVGMIRYVATLTSLGAAQLTRRTGRNVPSEPRLRSPKFRCRMSTGAGGGSGYETVSAWQAHSPRPCKAPGDTLIRGGQRVPQQRRLCLAA